jgi:hypothetical protein
MLKYKYSEIFYTTFRKWLGGKCEHTQEVVLNVFHRNPTLFVSNSMKKIVEDKGKVILVLFLLLCSCHNPTPTVQTYLIEEGSHYCTPHPISTITGSTLAFEAYFHNDCAYNLENEDQQDLNKLYGFADNNSAIHNHSARFAWRYIADKNIIEVWAYWYNSGAVSYVKMGDVELSTWHTYSISASGSLYDFSFDGVHHYAPRSAPANGIKLKAYPYFGGNTTAPHTMRISIKEL